jgi:hypothetical protein
MCDNYCCGQVRISVTNVAPTRRWKRFECKSVVYWRDLQYVLNAIVRDVWHELVGANVIVINSIAA